VEEEPLTIGKITIEHTESRGRPGEETFDNYMPQNERRESYMADETGIGTGTIHTLDRIFATREEAQTEADRRNATEPDGEDNTVQYVRQGGPQ